MVEGYVCGEKLGPRTLIIALVVVVVVVVVARLLTYGRYLIRRL